MAISLIGGVETRVDSGNSYTAGSGTSSRVVSYGVGITRGGEGAPGFSTGTFGAASMTQAGSTAVNTEQRWMAQSSWYVKNADIPGGSNTITVNTTGSPDDSLIGAALTLDGVDQTTPIYDSVTASVENATSITADIDVKAGGFILVVIGKEESGATWGTAPTGCTQGFSDDHAFSGEQTFYYRTTSSDTTLTIAPTWTGACNASMVIISYNPAGANQTLAVDAGEAAVEGQSVSANLSMAVQSGSLVIEQQDVALLFDQAYVISVSAADAAIEGQEVPFILTQPGTSGELVISGSDISLLFNDTVQSADAAMEGQNISLIFGGNTSVIVTSTDCVFAGSTVNLTPTGQVTTEENFVKSMVRSFVRKMAFPPTDIGRQV